MPLTINKAVCILNYILTHSLCQKNVCYSDVRFQCGCYMCPAVISRWFWHKHIMLKIILKTPDKSQHRYMDLQRSSYKHINNYNFWKPMKEIYTAISQLGLRRSTSSIGGQPQICQYVKVVAYIQIQIMTSILSCHRQSS